MGSSPFGPSMDLPLAFHGSSANCHLPPNNKNIQGVARHETKPGIDSMRPSSTGNNLQKKEEQKSKGGRILFDKT